MKIPYHLQDLSYALENILKRGKDKLSDLFLIIKADQNEDFIKTLPDHMIKEIRENLKQFQFNVELKKAISDPNTNNVISFSKFSTDLEKNVDTHKIRVFFRKDAPKNAILSRRKFNYPNTISVSTKHLIHSNMPEIND